MQEIKSIDQFNEILLSDFVVFIAKSKACSVCSVVQQKLEDIMSNYPTINSYYGYIDEIDYIRGQHIIFTVPTVIMFYQGDEIFRESRFINFNNIEKTLSRFEMLNK